ncbi:MAG: sugar ABC transporter substrate-binding protein [Clostridiaceae bacterium]|nr:sugar ABC transporter substrate-binding protein [Clostridiaceae bacterium]
MKNKIIAVLCALVLLVSAVGCGEKTDSSEAVSSTTSTIENDDTDESTPDENQSVELPSIGVSFGQNVHPFFVAMQKGIEQACSDYNITDLNILAADSKLEVQNTQLEDLVTMGCDVILLNPYDSDGVVNAVKNATDSGVAIFTMDINCDGSTAFIASDNYEIGKMLAEYVIDQLNGEGKIAIIDGISVTSLKDRTEGFMETIGKSNIEIVAEEQTAHARDTALTSAENILQAHSDIDAFVGINENSGMAILSAVTSANLLDDIIITTVDATSENMVAIRDGKVDVGVSQDPYQMGYIAVEQAIALTSGKTVESFVEVPVEYMDKDNIQTFIDREIGYGVEVD